MQTASWELFHLWALSQLPEPLLHQLPVGACMCATKFKTLYRHQKEPYLITSFLFAFLPEQSSLSVKVMLFWSPPHSLEYAHQIVSTSRCRAIDNKRSFFFWARFFLQDIRQPSLLVFLMKETQMSLKPIIECVSFYVCTACWSKTETLKHCLPFHECVVGLSWQTLFICCIVTRLFNVYVLH